MSDPYSQERAELNRIGSRVREIQERITNLQYSADYLRSQIANLPREYDEDGNDMNESLRDALESELSSVYAQISEEEGNLSIVRSTAETMISNFSSLQSQYQEKVRHLGNTRGDFNRLQGMRFGGSTAAAGSRLVDERQQHYEDHIQALGELIADARAAINGYDVSGGGTTIRERGSFQKPGASSAYAGGSGGRNRSSAGTGPVTSGGGSWSGAPGNSIKKPAGAMVATTMSVLGLAGITYVAEKANLKPVSMASVSLNNTAEGLKTAMADAALAKRYGVPAEDIVDYRTENNLVWHEDCNGHADLIPADISAEHPESRLSDGAVTPQQKLMAYMSAHNYGKEDAETYTRDPEWQKLHREAYPESGFADRYATPQQELMAYMSAHNCGGEDAATYMKDPDYLFNMVKDGKIAGDFESVLKHTEFKEKPKIVTDEEFEHCMQQSGTILFRTFHNNENDSAQYFKERFMTDSAGEFKHNGTGGRVYGNGIYCTANPHCTSGLRPSESDIERPRDVSIGYGNGYREHRTSVMTISPDTKIVDELKIQEEYFDLPVEIQNRFVYKDEWGALDVDYAAYAVTQGYDGMRVKEAGGTGCDYLVIYNRSKLIVLDDPDNKAYGIY